MFDLNDPIDTYDVLNMIGPAPAACAGDCDEGGPVTVDELFTRVKIALGIAPDGACLAANVSADGQVTIDELVVAVSKALRRCHARGGGTRFRTRR